MEQCKILGSLLNTENDIERRNSLAITSFDKLKPIFKSRTVSEQTKIRIFVAYVESIFFYNSELWTINKTLNNKIDTIQRIFLRKVLGIYYPKIIKNDRIYEKTSQIPWSIKIKKRALNCLGHLLRLHETTPTRRALAEGIKKMKRPQGRPKDTWIKMIENYLKDSTLNINFKNDETMINDLIIHCSDRKGWRTFVKNIKL